jgi:hypothetical protein
MKRNRDGEEGERRDDSRGNNSSYERDTDRNSERDLGRKYRDRDNFESDGGQQVSQVKSPIKKILMSAVGAVSSSDRWSPQHADVSSHESADSKLKPNITLNAEGLNRSKRLFGSLMGHLGSARKKLEQDSEKIEQQSLAKQEATNKHLLEGKKLQESLEEIHRLEKEKVS